MKWIGKVIFFFINTIWYINIFLNWPLKTGVSLVFILTTLLAVFGGGSAWEAFFWFILLTFVMSFPALYKPKGFDDK